MPKLPSALRPATNVWDFLKVFTVCVLAYALGSKLTASNWDITEFNTGAVSSGIGVVAYIAVNAVIAAVKKHFGIE